MSITRNRWAHDFLDLLNAKHCSHNADALISWIQAEGGNATFNPLNTTEPWPNSTIYNSVGVRNFATYEDGLHATVKTILQVDPSLGFTHIVNDLRHCTKARRTLRHVEGSQWGTGGLALRVLPFVKKDYWTYANHTIAGS